MLGSVGSWTFLIYYGFVSGGFYIIFCCIFLFGLSFWLHRCFSYIFCFSFCLFDSEQILFVPFLLLIFYLFLLFIIWVFLCLVFLFYFRSSFCSLFLWFVFWFFYLLGRRIVSVKLFKVFFPIYFLEGGGMFRFVSLLFPIFLILWINMLCIRFLFSRNFVWEIFNGFLVFFLFMSD